MQNTCVRRSKTASLDARDRLILAALSKNAWLTYAQLGERANLSSSATQRRVERLLKARVIEGATARIAASASDRPVILHVLVELRDESTASLAALSRRLEGNPAVEAAHYVTGSFDVLVTMRCAAMEEYAAFAEEHLNGNPYVTRYKTLTVLRSLL